MADYPELVIFDCDGTLVDTERIAVRVNLELLSEIGGTFTKQEVEEKFVGASMEVYVRLVEEHLGVRVDHSWMRKWSVRFRELCEEELVAVDGVAEAIDGITAALCVASNGAHSDINRNLEIAGLHHHFAGRIFSASDVAVGKPAPDLFLHAARELGVDPARCIVIEDSIYGVQAARAAGMRAYAYAGGYTAADRLDGPGTHVFSEMRDLPTLIRATF